MGFLVTLFTKSMQDEENVLFFFLKSAFGKKICQGINWRSVLLNDEVSWRHSCPNSVISSGTGKHEIVSQAGVNFSSCSDFMLSLGLSTLQISPVRGMYLVLAELLLLDSGCKNSLITFLSFLGNEVCRLENYYCCYMWNSQFETTLVEFQPQCEKHIYDNQHLTELSGIIQPLLHFHM